MARFNLELLVIFDEIYQTKSITRAAANLGVAQPTISIALGKLRQHFGDPLFSRTAKGMEPTPFAQQIIGEVRDIVSAANGVLTKQAAFAPAQSDREFKVAMTDLCEIVMLPGLLNAMRVLAPAVSIDVVKISQDLPALLRGGEIDLALGFLPHLDAGFYQQKLFEQDFVCMVAADHPRIRDGLSLAQFSAEHHAIVKNSRNGRSIVDRIMVTGGLNRKVAVRLPSYLGAVRVVAQTESIAIVPERLGTLMSQREAIRCFAVPLTLPRFEVKQHWHERFHLDPGNRWLRNLIADRFLA